MEVSKRAQKKINRRSLPERKATPQIIKKFDNHRAKLVTEHIFESGHKVPVYEVDNIYALNQIIGYAKFINSDYGTVYYRGECHLHSSLCPSIFHGAGAGYDKLAQELNSMIAKTLTDNHLRKTFKLEKLKVKTAELIVESTLQHYGIPTRFVDVVDNHWIALWFGQNKCQKIKNQNVYYQYVSRDMSPVEIMSLSDANHKELYQYLLLIAADTNLVPLAKGIYTGKDVITIDLRASLPSTFLRPHAQHGLVLTKNRHDTNDTYDLSSNVVGIVKMRVDHVAKWLGYGELLSAESLFPSPAFDFGYERLLSRQDIYSGTHFAIANYTR